MLKSILLITSFMTLNSIAFAGDIFTLSFYDRLVNENKQEFYQNLESAESRKEVLEYNSEIFSKIKISRLKKIGGASGVDRNPLQVNRVKIGGEGGGE